MGTSQGKAVQSTDGKATITLSAQNISDPDNVQGTYEFKKSSQTVTGKFSYKAPTPPSSTLPKITLSESTDSSFDGEKPITTDSKGNLVIEIGGVQFLFNDLVQSLSTK